MASVVVAVPIVVMSSACPCTCRDSRPQVSGEPLIAFSSSENDGFEVPGSVRRGGRYGESMAHLPQTTSVPVVRADFSDDALWARLTDEILRPTDEGFGADVEFVDDPTLTGLDEASIVDAIPRAYPNQYRHPVMFVIDSVTVSLPDHPLLVIDLREEDAANAFRSVPRQIQSIQNNLSLANLDFTDFAAATDADGVFRGFYRR
jgi:hypothetical protein